MQTSSYHAFLEELYNRFKVKNINSIREIVEKIIPESARKFHIKNSWLKEFYDVADLLLQTQAPDA